MKSKILHVITNFAQIGGAEQMLVRFINASPEEVEHVIISLIEVSDILASQIDREVKYYAIKARSPIELICSAFKVSRLLKAEKATLIYSWMYHANFSSALAKVISGKKVPLFWGVRHSLDDLKSEKVSTKLAIYAGRALRFIPDKVIYCSKKSMCQHISLGYSEESHSIYIPNGYQIPEFKKKNFEKRSFVLGAAGRFHEAKNYKMLFKSVAPILLTRKDIKLKVAGRNVDNENNIIKGYLKEFSIDSKQVELVGQQSDMKCFYESIDFFVLSSKTEGFPNVLAEAGGHGCIVFSTDVGDANLIVNDSKRIVAVNDSDSLTSVLLEYLSFTPDALTKISEDSAKYIRENYSIEVIVKRVIAIMEKF